MRCSFGWVVRWVTWALLAAAAVSAPAAVQAAPDGVLVLREARVWPGRGDWPTSDATGRPLALPALGGAAPLAADGAGSPTGSLRLRLRFDRPAGLDASTLLAAHVPLSCGWLDLDLNGQAVHRDAAEPPDVASTCPRPRLFPLPAVALKDRDNVLEIRLHGPLASRVGSVRRAPGLSAVWIGPHAVLAEAQVGPGFRHVTTVRILDVVVLMFGGVMLLLSAADTRGRHPAWLGLTALAWAAVLAPVWWNAVPVRGEWLEPLLGAWRALAAACAIHFLTSFAERPLPQPLSLTLWLQCGLVPLSLVFLPHDWLRLSATAWSVLLALQTLTALGVSLMAFRHTRPAESRWMAGAAVAAAAVWLLDAAMRPDGLPWPTALAWAAASPWGWSTLLIAAGLRLLHLFKQALAAAEASRLSLESQVREITAEIEVNFAQLSELRVEQVTEQERRRIAADLHDDLGAKLLTIVHTCDNERIAALGREALDEMRLSVRGLSGRPMRLGDAMADWRAETVQRLGQTNIQVEWESPDDDVDHILPARAFVQTTRILREAVSNIIKHSGASRCEVRCFAGDGEYGLVVEDNGRGISVDFDGGLDRGHGMASMKHRAKQLQGQCLVESSSGMGTVIRLSLPL